MEEAAVPVSTGGGLHRQVSLFRLRPAIQTRDGLIFQPLSNSEIYMIIIALNTQ
jgi:hypothetical protein